MSSSVHEVKEELARVSPSRRCCRTAEISTLLHMDGTYRIRGHEGHSLVTESNNTVTARKIYTLIHSLFTIETTVVKVERSTPRRGSVYGIEIPDQPGFFQVMNELGVLDRHLAPEETVPARLLRGECCASAALRGAFLGGGFVSSPFGQADFEIAFPSRLTAETLRALFVRKGLEPGIRTRRNQCVLYMKSRSEITTFLAVTGAHGTCLDWESQTVINTTKNRVNRLVNCDAANARRIAESSARQREAISRLRSAGFLDTLGPALTELALAREQNPLASLEELGSMMDPPVSKSVVQGRMRKLETLAGP